MSNIFTHCHLVTLYAFWYNFVKMHKALRMIPAGVSDRLWSMEDIVRLTDEREDRRTGKLLVS